jgi:hypothetical protein
MRVRLEATVEELQKRGEDLIHALADQLSAFNPDLADLLEKAVPHKTPKPPYRVLRDLKQITTAEYKRQLDAMLKDIGAVLASKPLKKAFGDPPEKPEPGEEPEEKPEPGEYDPKTDTIVPEPENEEDEDEEEEKSMPLVEKISGEGFIGDADRA